MGNGCKGRDAKVVARALRDALQANAIKITHSDRLELIAKAFGCENWNVLSAKIEATRALGSERRVHEPTLTKTFCGKTQQEAKRLIAGPLPIFVCDECVERGPGRLCLTAPASTADRGRHGPRYGRRADPGPSRRGSHSRSRQDRRPSATAGRNAGRRRQTGRAHRCPSPGH
jgi:Glyoxalase superfamily protein/ClpX C4-type zinc finger